MASAEKPACMDCAFSCDTFVLLPDVTADRSIIFAKNSDRSRNEAQSVEYIDTHDGPILYASPLETDEKNLTPLQAR